MPSQFVPNFSGINLDTQFSVVLTFLVSGRRRGYENHYGGNMPLYVVGTQRQCTEYDFAAD